MRSRLARNLAHRDTGMERSTKGINVKDTVRLWTWAKAVDLVDFGKWRYNMLGNASHWFPGNTVKKHDKAMREALSNSPHADRIMEILEEVRTIFADAPVERRSQSYWAHVSTNSES